MHQYSKIIFKNIFVIVCCNKSQSDKKSKAQYRSILDNISINLLIASFENRFVINAVMKLSELERIIIVFHYILDFDLNEVSVILQSTPSSIYSQKSKAIKKMKSILNVV